MFLFDPKGYLVPDRPIKANLEQFREAFVDKFPDASRRKIYENFRQFCGQIMDLFQFDQVTIWVDGSFVTHKRTPNDLDIVVFIDSDRIDQKHDLFQSQLSHEHLQTIYRIDAYWVKVYPESHPFYHHTLADKAYWLNLFTRTYRNRQGVSFKKGFLDITVLSHEI